MLESYLVQTCSIVTTSRNEYGDFVYSTVAVENCRFREISTIRRMSNQEVNDTDALIHLIPATVAVKGSIILHDGVYYQVERITYARKLGKSTIEFVKAELKITDIAIS